MAITQLYRSHILRFTLEFQLFRHFAGFGVEYDPGGRQVNIKLQSTGM